MALESEVAAGAGIEGLIQDGSLMVLGVVDEEWGAALVGDGAVVPSSVFATNSTVASAFSLAFKAPGLSLVILDSSSECVPPTAFETVSSVFLTRDMCWLRPADHREAEVFRWTVLVWNPSLCRNWLALKSHPFRPVMLRCWMCLQLERPTL